MHAFATSSLCTTNNQFAVLAAQDHTNSNASPVCSRTSLPPLLSPISKASMHTATNNGAKWVSQGIYTLLVAVSQLGTDTPQSSTAQGINTTLDSLKGDADGGVSVKLENMGTNNIQEALKDLKFKHTCICKQQEQEEEEEQQKRANHTENQKQEQEELELYAYPGEGWIATTSEPFTVPNDNGTFTQANYHKYYLDNAKYPLICTTLGKGYPVHTALLIPMPVQHLKNYITANQSHLFSGREPFTKAITYATSDLGDEALLAALHAYHHWEKEEIFTVQEITCLNSQRAFQCIKLMEWKEALKSADAYDRIAEQMRDHIPWGAREQTAIGQVIPCLKKHTYTHWEEDTKGIKMSWEVKDHPQKQKKCAKCHKTGHFHCNCPLRAAYQQRL